MSSNQTARFRQTLFRDISRTRTRPKMVLWGAHRSAASLPTALDYLTWPATFGNGPPIGIERITTKRLPEHIRLYGIHKDRRIASIRRSRACQSAFIEVGRFF